MLDNQTLKEKEVKKSEKKKNACKGGQVQNEF